MTWPAPPFPYEAFGLSFGWMDGDGRDRAYQEREARPDAILLAADGEAGAALAYLALHEIDWAARRVGNFGLRVHPGRCDRGLGTALLGAVTGWLFAGGMATVGVEVAASNGRAVRCYEKAGFERVGSVWRPAPDLAGVDLAAERHAFLREHLRQREAGPELRFWLMEMRAPHLAQRAAAHRQALEELNSRLPRPTC